MERKYIVNIVCAGLMMLASCNNGYDEYGWADPPRPEQSGSSAALGYFVKTDGTGDGSSWDDAMSPSTFLAKLKGGFDPGADIYLAAGTYLVGSSVTECLTFTTGVCLHGGYAPDSKGVNTNISYPSDYETVFSGDLNGNGKADEGDMRLADVTTTIPVTFKGITFRGGYISSTVRGERSGITVTNGGSVNMEYCKIENCNNTVASPSHQAGGSAIYISYGDVRMSKCIVRNNMADNRGGAIRLMKSEGHTSHLYMDDCLITGNKVSGPFGGAIQVSGTDCPVVMNNCTVANNSAASGGAGINSPSPITLANCTFADNLCTVDGREGHEMRIESNGLVHIINSIFVEHDGKSSASSPSICVNGGSFAVVSDGYCYYSYAKGKFTSDKTDVKGIGYQQLFGNGVLADNDGYPQTIALANSALKTTPLSAVQSFAVKYGVPFQVSLDQRGMSRGSSLISPGAFEISTQPINNF